jgi:hypothetical protein
MPPLANWIEIAREPGLGPTLLESITTEQD